MFTQHGTFGTWTKAHRPAEGYSPEKGHHLFYCGPAEGDDYKKFLCDKDTHREESVTKAWGQCSESITVWSVIPYLPLTHILHILLKAMTSDFGAGRR